MNLLLTWTFSILLYKYLWIKVVDFRQKPICMQLCKKQRMVFSTSNVFDSSIKILQRYLYLLRVIIMSRTSFRVNPHSVVCLNAKELLAWSRRYIWSLSDSNGIRTRNHLFRKRTLNNLTKLAKNWKSETGQKEEKGQFD